MRGQVQDAYANLDMRGEHPAAREQSVSFAFEFPELLAAFETIDAEAQRLKSSSRTLGILAIVLVLGALLLAASEPLITTGGLNQHYAGYLAAFLGVVGTAIGLNALRSRSGRRLWLLRRFQAETLRLFHFEYIAARLPQIAAARSKADRTAYVVARAGAFATLLADLEALQPRETLLLLEDPGACPLASSRVDPAPVRGRSITPVAASALAAWRELRLGKQVAYCDAKLAPGARAGALNPLRQEQLFSLVGWACVAAVVGLHVVHLGGDALHQEGPWIQVAILWVAMISLALRALEDGFAPQREVERYEQYRANVTVALERFDAAKTLPAKMETMLSFSRLSQEELHVFIRTQAKSHFVL